ncbi:hypothetical protein CAP48_07875 [Advenella sp. S44]|uniref:GNAT family N-acetyltransferase n=1 Tax=Advenella sp. S44 TaxID=1982755 RepID=UPI000C2A7F66|nr:GNAT family N-acetyltransferase [Advenella sp. S44]PJX25936.1 hypothetical protein CAP48_07875 [Advenella sp. S44]
MKISTENKGQTASPPLRMRPLRSNDLPQMLALQADVYPPALLESAEVLSSKIDMVPAGWTSLAAVDGEILCAYAIGYPWRSDRQLCWNRPLARQHNCDVLYLHDVAVSPSYARQGIAGQLVSQLMQQGRQFGLANAILIAVAGAHGYWSRLGFMPDESRRTDPAFGARAMLMRCSLVPVPARLSGTS